MEPMDDTITDEATDEIPEEAVVVPPAPLPQKPGPTHTRGDGRDATTYIGEHDTRRRHYGRWQDQMGR